MGPIMLKQRYGKSDTGRSNFDLIIRQQPARARVCCGSKERERRPVDPPPIIQLRVTGDQEFSQNYLQSPSFFMCANLMNSDKETLSPITGSEALAGTIVSSLYRLKDVDDTDAGFFIWGDISIKIEGTFRLKFSLFEVANRKTDDNPSLEAIHIKSVLSQPFTVYSSKVFPGMGESTFLSRSFSDQGVRIKLRKEHRMQMKQSRTPADSALRNKKEPGDIAGYAPVLSTSDQYNTGFLVSGQQSITREDPIVLTAGELTPQHFDGKKTMNIQAFLPYVYNNTAVEYSPVIAAPGVPIAYKQDEQWFMPPQQNYDRMSAQVPSSCSHPMPSNGRRMSFGTGVSNNLAGKVEDVPQSPRSLQSNPLNAIACQHPSTGMTTSFLPFTQSRRKSFLASKENANAYTPAHDQFQGLTNRQGHEVSWQRDQQYPATSRASEIMSNGSRSYSMSNLQMDSSQTLISGTQHIETNYRSANSQGAVDPSCYLDRSDKGFEGTGPGLRGQLQEMNTSSTALKLPPLQNVTQRATTADETESAQGTGGYSRWEP